MVPTSQGTRSWWRRKGDDTDHSTVDWTKLSRKHAVETDRVRGIVTIFGGKLTDCLNVGKEVADEIEALGVPLEADLRNWYGEPAEASHVEFYRQAGGFMRLEYRTKTDTEPLTDRLWRRYGRRRSACSKPSAKTRRWRTT